MQQLPLHLSRKNFTNQTIEPTPNCHESFCIWTPKQKWWKYRIWSNLIKFDIFKMFLNCDEFVWNHLWKHETNCKDLVKRFACFKLLTLITLTKCISYHYHAPNPSENWTEMNVNVFFDLGTPATTCFVDPSNALLSRANLGTFCGFNEPKL